MAEKCIESLQPEIGRELCLVKGKNGEFLGYKRDILTENLSERENTMFVCIRCQGIMREVCLSSDGEQFCSCCKKEDEKTHPNLHVSNMVLSFKCSCPLIARGCGWLGALGGCQDHLDTCGYVYETCKLRCGVVLQRNELKVHEKENCPQRIVECKHCRKDFKSCELTTHLEMCPKMEVLCELKCGKRLCRENMAQHMEQECGLVVEMCKLGCGVELTRDELKIHVTDTCVQRIIPCKHCEEDFKYCDMTNHLDVCPTMKVLCELGCGVIMCREDMTQHLEVDCPDKELECPFAKYKCEMGLIKRKNMSKHLEEKRIEHLELKLMEESEIIAKQSVMIETMSQEIKLLNTKMQVMQDLNLIPIKLEWRITELPLPDFKNVIKKTFLVAGYLLEFELCRNYLLVERFRIRIRPLTGCYSEELKWPFEAKFVTHFNSQRNRKYKKEFKSEVIIMEKRNFNSDSIISFTIAQFSKDDFMNHYIDGATDIEFFAIFL